MSSNTELLNKQSGEFAYHLVIDGFLSSFCDNEELEGAPSDSNSWIYADRYITSASVTASLQTPDSITLSTDFFEPDLGSDRTTFRLNDIDGRHTKLFASTRAVVETLGDDLLPGVAVTASDTTEFGSELFGKQIGNELIGPAGERQWCNATYSTNLAGFRHSPRDDRAIPVTSGSEPLVMKGRRAVLRKIGKDENGEWLPSSSGSIIWVGAVSDVGRIEQGKVYIDCDGAGAWLEKNLGTLLPEQEYGINNASITYAAEDGHIFAVGSWRNIGRAVEAANPGVIPLGTIPQNWVGVSQTYHCSGTVETAATTKEGIIADIQTLIDGIKDTDQNPTGLRNYYDEDTNSWFGNQYEGPWSNPLQGEQVIPSSPHAQIELTDDGTFRIACNERSSPDGWHYPVWEIGASEKIWLSLGFDPRYQGGLDFGDGLYVTFRKWGATDPTSTEAGLIYSTAPGETTSTVTSNLGNGGSQYDAPNASYWIATFTTVAPDYDPTDPLLLDLFESGFHWQKIQNYGSWRTFSPVFERGVRSIDGQLNGGNGTIITLEDENIPSISQRFAAPAGDPTASPRFSVPYTIPGVGDVNSTAIGMIFGKRLLGKEKVDECQIVSVSWVSGSDGNILENGFNTDLYLHFLHPPKRFGVDRPRLKGNWMFDINEPTEETQLKFKFLNHWSQRFALEDDPVAVAVRIMHSDGDARSYWEGWHGNPWTNWRPNGANNLSGYDSYQNATNIFAEGLGIPGEFIAAPDVWLAEQGKVPEELKKIKVRNSGPISAKQILGEIFKSRGWIWSFDNCQFAPLSLFNGEISPDRATVDIDDEAFTEAWDLKQNFRIREPLDHIVFKYSRDVRDNKITEEHEIHSYDRGASSRGTNVTETITDGTIPLDAERILSAIRKVARNAFDFWEKRHFIATFKIHRAIEHRIFPGTIVRFTSAKAVNALGDYGITNAVGVVQSITRMCKREESEISVLVFGDDDGSGSDKKIFAPIGQCVRLADSKLYLKDRWYGRGGGTKDGELFTTASWMDTDGEAEIAVFQYDRNVWSLAGTGSVQGFVNDAGADSSYLQLADTIPGYLRDRYGFVILKTANNAEWVQTHFSEVVNSGTLGDRW